MPSTEIYTLSLPDALPISLLGDRARIDHEPGDDGVLIRSTAAGTRLGGLAPPTREAAQALAAAFDVVVVETVGVGQSETDVEEDRKSTRLNSSHANISYAVDRDLHSFPTRRSSDLAARRSRPDRPRAGGRRRADPLDGRRDAARRAGAAHP